MISLRLKADFEKKHYPPFVVKISSSENFHGPFENETTVAKITNQTPSIVQCESSFGKFTIFLKDEDEYEDDVLLCLPETGKVQRIYRANSRYNSILLTERCDQLCVMCSQPPRRTYDKWRFPLFKEAFDLIPEDGRVVISGGEPTVYKEELFDILNHTATNRPDVSFQILSNCQHFTEQDIEPMKALHNKIDILWGIPLYSHDEENHDLIVGKKGAFNPLMENLFLLASSGAAIELRTVLTAKNALDLPQLAVFVADHIPFISRWAIMAMEPIGFAKANREQLFYDHSIAPQPLSKTLDICKLRGINATLFNFPRCTIEARHRHYCAQSISDWKNKFLSECEGCVERDICAGFFEWYDKKWAWENVRKII